MDRLDIAILSCLRENARQSATDISRKVNLSVAAVTERIRKLEQNGVIEKYTILLNQHQVGNDVMALMEVSLEHPKYYDEFTKIVNETEEIVSCSYITGDFDFVLKINAFSSAQLEEIHRMIKCIKGVSGTKTSFILKELKNSMAFIKEDKKI